MTYFRVVLYCNSVSLPSRSDLSRVCSTLRILLSSDKHVWFTSVSTGRPVLSEELSSPLRELTLISWEPDVFLPSFMLPSSLNLSRIGFGVGLGWLEKLDWSNNFSFWLPNNFFFKRNSLVHSWRSEIFDGNRSDMYAFSYRTSPVFNLTTFGIPISWKCSLKNDCIRSSLIECQSLLIARIMSTHFTASWCLFYALCKYCARKYCARRVTIKTISSRFLWLLSLRSIGRKYTVCLFLEFWPPSIDPELMIEWRLNSHPKWFLEFWPPSIDPELMIEWRLNSHPKWFLYWKNPLGITTLSCKKSSIRFRPECPWRDRKNDYSWIISAVLKSSFCSSSCCKAYFPSIVRPKNRFCELVLKVFFYSPEMNRSILFSMYLLGMTKKMN